MKQNSADFNMYIELNASENRIKREYNSRFPSRGLFYQRIRRRNSDSIKEKCDDQSLYVTYYTVNIQ